MLLNDPGRTQYDLNFQIAGIPVRVHPMFWLIATLLGADLEEPLLVLMWVVVAFVSIVIHELGHAFAARSYGWEPSITLHGFGGLASYRPTRNDPMAQIAITAAGPMAGFAVAGGAIALVMLSGNSVQFFGLSFGEGPSIANDNLRALVYLLLFINVFWGLLNCLPILPLDGGRIAAEVLNLMTRGGGLALACQISIVTAIAMVIVSLTVFSGSLLMPLFFGYFAYSNYTTLQALRGGGFGGPRW